MTYLADNNGTIFTLRLLVQIFLLCLLFGDLRLVGNRARSMGRLFVVHEIVGCAAAADTVVKVSGIVIGRLEFGSRSIRMRFVVQLTGISLTSFFPG